MKKMIAILLILSLVFVMWGCVSDTTSSTDSQTTSTTTAPGVLDGKKIIFIGNSQTYVGNVVSQVYNKDPRLESREHNMGLFYLLCKSLGSEVNVVNWTFSQHGLRSIFGAPCKVKGDCQNLNHEDYLTDRVYDYVVVQPGVGTNSEESLVEDIAYIVKFFRDANPDVKFVLLGNASVYGNNNTNTTYPGITGYYETLSEQGFIMADWGKLVNDLIHGIVTPEGSDFTYNKNSFIIKDGFHPNLLSGYIASVMAYCAITGTSAADIPATMYQEPAMVAALDSHLEKYYENPEYDTNCKSILTTPSELEQIHLLIDQYLADAN